MRKYLLIMLVLVAAALVVTGCAAPVPPTPAPTPRPTTAPTSVPPPTVMPPTATTAPTMTPTTIPTPAATATLAAPTMTPTRTRVPATSAPRATVTPTRAPAPKGNLLYHRNDSGRDYLRVLNLETNITTELVDTGPVMDLALGTNAHLGEFSPDNTRFAYIFAGSPGVANVLRVLDLRTGDTRALFSSEPAPGSGLSSPSWSPDGTRIAFIWMRSNQSFWAVGVINADGTNRKDLRVNPGGESYRGGISWSKQNVLAIAQNVGAPSEIFTLFTDGGGLTNRSNNPADDSTPVWSPDGKQLAFTSNRDGRQQIYVMNADGSGVRRVSQSSTNDHSPSWSPDGNWIAFASFREGGTDVYMMDLRGGNVKRLTTGGGDHPVWSK